MVSKIVGLQFHIETYTWEDEYEGGYPLKKGSSEH